MFIEILKNEYYDSVTLMSLSANIERSFEGSKVIVSMATPMNIEILEGLGFVLTDCTSNDLVIAIIASNEEEIAALIHEKLSGSTVSSKKEVEYSTLGAAIKDNNFNLGVISVPGDYAYLEAKKMLDEGIHVMMFSDNVTYEEELELKKIAISKNLLMMGPDCGTSIINGKGICFANNVRRGDIGIISASGTGLQEVSVNIDKLGGGISQAIGVGGRDLSLKIGGLMMLATIDALENDANTKTIVLISKPPVEEIKNKILSKLKTVSKRVVVYFIDSENDIAMDNVVFSKNLYDTALKAVGSKESVIKIQDFNLNFKDEQKYIRGLFCGGTLCLEALSFARKAGLKPYSNIAKNKEELLSDNNISHSHSFIDLGDDFFTNGRPHPMIEPSIRLERIIKEAQDPEVKVLILDFELGYGSHEAPVDVTIEYLLKAKEIRTKLGYGDLAIIAYVLGTDKDFQGLNIQESLLTNALIYVVKSNVELIESAISLVGGNYGSK